MILINLLPYREERRKRRKQQFFAGLGLSFMVGALIVGLGWLFFQQLIENQQSRNQFLQSQISQLEAQIKDIASLRDEIDALTRRQKAVEALQAERNMPVHLLNELATLAPEGVYFTSVKQAERSVTLTGLAQTQERVSEFLRNASRDAQWLERPELTEIKLASVTTNSRDAKRLFDFTLKLTLKGLSTEPEANAQAPRS
ncbi:type IV pilus assembly protein PilN [Inhella inkyongensis]|uniref:Type IV pilus assembly protein PilN n=1 Tax=Inhella inkyongensis TaxID=392593 RepID=A0A840S2I2_9BURK|nr:PilN domain-containing protein [Inhella inkyongensis]MBB5203296.1 type IV pilus assembly protein PilN [Inhella inkyongensis]